MQNYIIYLLSKNKITFNEIYFCLKPLHKNINKTLLSNELSMLLAKNIITTVIINKVAYYQMSKYYTHPIIIDSNIDILKSNMLKLRNKKLSFEERKSRLCYKHLAGQAGVIFYKTLLKNLIREVNNRLIITDFGFNYFKKLGIQDNILVQPVKQCLDYTERNWHLGGKLAKQLTNIFIEKNFITPTNTRHVIINSNYFEFLKEINLKLNN